MRNIYDYIEEIRQRPGMFSSDLSLGPIETLLYGYCACLEINQIEEDYEGRRFRPSSFSSWIYDEMGWSGSLGFSYAIEENSPDPEAAFNTFFSLVKRFRDGQDAGC